MTSSVSELVHGPVLFVQLDPLPGTFRIYGSAILIVADAISINGPVEALGHVVRLENVRIGNHDDLEGVGQNVAMLEGLDDAFLTQVVEDALNDSGVE